MSIQKVGIINGIIQKKVSFRFSIKTIGFSDLTEVIHTTHVITYSKQIAWGELTETAKLHQAGLARLGFPLLMERRY